MLVLSRILLLYTTGAAVAVDLDEALKDVLQEIQDVIEAALDAALWIDLSDTDLHDLAEHLVPLMRHRTIGPGRGWS